MVRDRFAGKVALVTGAASGIGRAIAMRLHAEGAAIVAGDRDAEGLGLLAATLGERIATQTGDVTREADAEALVARATERFGGLDVAFNVAGGSRPAYLVDLTEEDWDFTVDLCLKGVFLGMKHQARQMLGQGRGDRQHRVAQRACAHACRIGLCRRQGRCGGAEPQWRA